MVKDLIKDKFERLLDFENQSKVLEYRFQYRNLLIWPYVRFAFFQEIMELREEETLNVHVNNRKIVALEKVVRKIRDFLKAIKSKKRISQKDILFIIGNGANIKNVDGKVYNRLFDEYAFVFTSNTAVFEKQQEGFSSENRAFPEVISARYMDYFVWLSSIVSRQNRKDIENIDAFLKYMENDFPFELSTDFYLDMRKRLLRQARSLRTQDRFFRRFLTSISPKVIFIEDACYGYDKAYRNWIANDMKIPTYEILHGALCMYHVAYNYSELLINSEEYCKYMPRYALTFGKFWEKNARLPMPCKILGSPNFTENMKKSLQTSIEIQGRILIILPKYHPEHMIDIVGYLLKHLDESYSVTVKDHPRPQANQSDFEQYNVHSNFSFYSTGNIFDFIEQSEYVVGEYFTPIYEATCYGKKVFVYRTEMSEMYISQEIGTWFDSPEELVKLIADKSEDKSNINPEYYFDSHWRENYIEIVNEELNK